MPRISNDQQWMSRALQLAAQAAEAGEVPVGAVVVLDGKEIGAGFNAPISGCDPT
ncbi:MAG: deaminase, partial [Pseudomonadota bacterium]|nr:deaminase [Pseudomonadota bacterium]